MLPLMRTISAGAAVALAAVLHIATPATAQQSTWQTIQERGTVRIGVLQGEPYGFKDPATGEWRGMMVSFGKAVAEALKVQPEFVEVSWGTAVPALQADKVDAVPFLNATAERAVTIEYANATLAYDALSLITHSDEDLSEWTKVNRPDLKIAVQQGSSGDAFVSRILTEPEIMRFPSYADQLAALQSGTVDAVVMYHSTLAPVVKKVGGKIVIPRPVKYSASDVALRREPEKTFKDWMTTAARYFYDTGQSQEWYEDFLRFRGIDTSESPSIQRENW